MKRSSEPGKSDKHAQSSKNAEAVDRFPSWVKAGRRVQKNTYPSEDDLMINRLPVPAVTTTNLASVGSCGIAKDQPWTMTGRSSSQEDGFAPLTYIVDKLSVGRRSSDETSDRHREAWEVPRRAAATSKDYLRFLSTQDKEILVKDRKYQPTNARIDFVCNVFDGILIILDRKITLTQVQLLEHRDQTLRSVTWATPFADDLCHGWNAATMKATVAYMTRSEGELSYYGVLASKTPPAMAANLNYVLMMSISDHADYAVIVRCLASRGIKGSEGLFWQGRQTFQLGHWAFYALLALTCCQGVAGFLAQNKSFMGHKVIYSITVFQPLVLSERPELLGYYNLADRPALILEIKPYDETLRQSARALEAAYFDAEQDKCVNFPDIPCARIGFD